MKTRSFSLDPLIREMISFRLYKRGKEPLQGIDPKDRIKRSVWRDDGVDLDLLAKEGMTFSKEIDDLGILIYEEVLVKEGLFRKRKPHKIMTDIASLDVIVDKASSGEKGDSPHQVKLLQYSELLHPVVLFRSAENLRETHAGLTIARNVQREVMDISPRSAVRILLQERKAYNDEDDLLRIFEKQVSEKFRIRTKSGSLITDLKTLISVILSSTDNDLRELLENDRILELARDGLHSPRLEGLFTDLSIDENGASESPERFKLRLGRAMMESEVAGEVFSKIAVPLLERFRTCSKGEASKLRGFLGPLMGLSASPLLSDLVFSAPSKNRPYIIGLMGDTGDRNLVETLKRIEDFSSVEEDCKAAKNALDSLGVG